jgi:hypothetical protein
MTDIDSLTAVFNFSITLDRLKLSFVAAGSTDEDNDELHHWVESFRREVHV